MRLVSPERGCGTAARQRRGRCHGSGLRVPRCLEAAPPGAVKEPDERAATHDKNARARTHHAEARYVVLAATLSVRELAAVLEMSVDEVELLIRSPDVSVWSLDAGHQRVGWRTARTLLSERRTDEPDLLQAGLDRLHELRAGLAEVVGEPPRLRDISRTDTAPVERYPDEQLLGFVREALGSSGGKLSAQQFTRWGLDLGVSSREICIRLGLPWLGVLARAGAPVVAKLEVAGGELDLVALLRDAAVAAGEGKKLSARFFDRWTSIEGIPCTSGAVVSAFGSWNAGKEAAGLATRRARPAVAETDLELLELMQQAAAALDAPALTIEQFDAWCGDQALTINAGIVIGRHGSWNAAKRRAGLELRPRGYRGHIGPTDRYADR